jgi:hypothetical protein
MTLTIEERIAGAELALKEGRIIQNAWRQQDDGGKGKGPGRELVCALAAFGPDINGSADCPADLMPRWLAELIPTLDDGIAFADVPWFMGELLQRAKRWSKLDDAAWERIRNAYLIMTIRQAVSAAEPSQPDPKPAYWAQVVDATNGVIAAIEQGVPAAADAARAAAYAAHAAAYAAADAARAAAYASSRKMYRTLAEQLFTLIDVEL